MYLIEGMWGEENLHLLCFVLLFRPILDTWNASLASQWVSRASAPWTGTQWDLNDWKGRTRLMGGAESGGLQSDPWKACELSSHFANILFKAAYSRRIYHPLSNLRLSILRNTGCLLQGLNQQPIGPDVQPLCPTQGHWEKKKHAFLQKDITLLLATFKRDDACRFYPEKRECGTCEYDNVLLSWLLYRSWQLGNIW